MCKDENKHELKADQDQEKYQGDPPTDLPEVEFTLLDLKVFPSEEKTIRVMHDGNYGGAHKYLFKNCNGFNDGKTEYVDSYQEIQFVQKNDDGTMVSGLQSEQLVLALLDRHEKLNARFPSPENAAMIASLKKFLKACKKRVQDRMSRGVMGDLKK